MKERSASDLTLYFSENAAAKNFIKMRKGQRRIIASLGSADIYFHELTSPHLGI
jgi:hypothetical protein